LIGRGPEPAVFLEETMDNLLDFAAPIAVAAVAIVLVLGLFNMLRGGSASVSQNLMRWRVILQFIAIVVILTVIWLKSSSS
jgi:hypothetical protein